MQEQLDAVYRERNSLVAALSKLLPAHLMRHPESDADWEADWRWIVCIHGPSGQMTWHIHDSQFPLFIHLQSTDNDWDGHTTEEKYKRLAELSQTARAYLGSKLLHVR